MKTTIAKSTQSKLRQALSTTTSKAISTGVTAALLAAFALTLVGCGSVRKAGREASYTAYEWVGIEKRDLLKKRVDTTKQEQQEASQKFGSALDRLKALSGFQGGELEGEYNSLKSAYERAADQAQDVSSSIKKVEAVADDLFAEWEGEIATIQTNSLRSKSRQTLAETKQRYDELHQNLKRSEDRMAPVLGKLNDQVLYLKHNLNAKALTSLKGEATTIQNDVEKLLTELNKSIASADHFIAQMP